MAGTFWKAKALFRSEEWPTTASRRPRFRRS
jgi:hypothetical protein